MTHDETQNRTGDAARLRSHARRVGERDSGGNATDHGCEVRDGQLRAAGRHDSLQVRGNRKRSLHRLNGRGYGQQVLARDADTRRGAGRRLQHRRHRRLRVSERLPR